MKGYLFTKSVNYDSPDGYSNAHVPHGTLYVPDARILIERYGTINGEVVSFKDFDSILYYGLLNQIRRLQISQQSGREEGGVNNFPFREIEVDKDLVSRVLDAKKALDDAPKNLRSVARELSLSVTKP